MTNPRFNIEVRFFPWLLIGDGFLRVCVYAAQREGLMVRGTAWFLQGVILPFSIILAAILYDAWLHDRPGLPNPIPAPRFTLGAATIYVGTLAAGVFTMYKLCKVDEPWLRGSIVGVLAIVYFLYLRVLRSFSVAVRVEAVEPPPEIDWHDANDRTIIRLEAERISLQQRVDTYTLESALFGALAFSAFVTIITSQGKRVEAAKEMFRTMDGFLLSLQTAGLKADFTKILAEDNLLAILAAFTLVCSVFFLTVIICRFRFNELLSRADYWIRIAGQFNAKEDEIQLNAMQNKKVRPRIERRLEQLQRDIRVATESATHEMERLEPVVTYMRLYRLLGVLVFASVLVLGAAFFSKALAGAFALLVLFVFAYPVADRMRDRAARHADDLQAASSRTLTGPGELQRFILS